MSLNLNPLGINAPIAPHPETDYRVPTVNANVASYPTGRNPMSLVWPIPRYTQPNIAPPSVKTGGTLL
jgi:hypothetical protein